MAWNVGESPRARDAIRIGCDGPKPGNRDQGSKSGSIFSSLPCQDSGLGTRCSDLTRNTHTAYRLSQLSRMPLSLD